MVPIDGDFVPVVLRPEPVIPVPVLGLSLGPMPLEPLPDCCASTRGAATKSTARPNTIVLLSLLNMYVSPLTLQVTFVSWAIPPGCTAVRHASRCIVPLRRPVYKESNSYAIRHSAIAGHWLCLVPIWI